MYIDKRMLHFINTSSIAVLLAFLLPSEHSRRVVGAILLLVLAIFTWLYIKKRTASSMNKREVLMIMGIIGIVYLVAYYLSGVSFGFYKNSHFLDFAYIVPIAIIIVSSEIIRFVIRSQNDKIADVVCYIGCVIAQTLIYGNFYAIISFYLFVDFVSVSLFPAILSNLLYHYLSKRYGMYPNIVYRLITTLYAYVIPFNPAMPDSLFAFANLFVPILIYFFIDSLYEKKRRYALEKKSKLAPVITGIVVVITAGFVALISNQFKYGTLIIATESMTGEINKGDAIIFEEYTGQPVEEGQVIVFERNDSMVVHRVVKIENVDGTVRYTTKGDANEDVDAGYATASDIVGLVNMKLPYVGYPSLWLRSLFD